MNQNHTPLQGYAQTIQIRSLIYCGTGASVPGNPPCSLSSCVVWRCCGFTSSLSSLLSVSLSGTSLFKTSIWLELIHLGSQLSAKVPCLGRKQVPAGPPSNAVFKYETCVTTLIYTYRLEVYVQAGPGPNRGAEYIPAFVLTYLGESVARDSHLNKLTVSY